MRRWDAGAVAVDAGDGAGDRTKLKGCAQYAIQALESVRDASSLSAAHTYNIQHRYTNNTYTTQHYGLTVQTSSQHRDNSPNSHWLIGSNLVLSCDGCDSYQLLVKATYQHVSHIKLSIISCRSPLSLLPSQICAVLVISASHTHYLTIVPGAEYPFTCAGLQSIRLIRPVETGITASCSFLIDRRPVACG